MNTHVNISLYAFAFALFTIGNGVIIGIDLGTTYCSVAFLRDGIVEVIPNDLGNRITPSYVAFTEAGERLIGETAKLQITHNPLNTIYNVKRLIGRKWDDEVVQKEIQLLSFHVVGKKGKPCIKVKIKGEDAFFFPEEITAMILERMKEFAEDYIGEEVDSAVITTPAYFNEDQRQATKDAGTLAGLNVRRILSEPTAAAMSFGLSCTSCELLKVLVFDIGGGTFDVSIVELDEGNFRVIATKGDTDLGGEDFNQRLLIHFIRQFKAENGENMANDPKSIQILRQEIEKAKRVLSVSLIAKIEINNLYRGKGFFTTITRAKFENLNEDLFTRTMSIVTTVLEDSGLQRKDIDEVVVVGGSSRIIKIQQLLKEFFGKEPRLDIHPDEAIAYGAAVQAGVLSKEEHTENILLVDVYPFSLGYELSNGTMQIIIPRNKVIPYEASNFVSTAEDYQENVALKIYRGDHSTANKNVLLAQLVLDIIPAAPKGVPTIKVKFEINADGILTVSAENIRTGTYKDIILKNVYRKLSSSDFEEMSDRMMSFRFFDLKRKERIHAKDTFEQVVYSVKQCINEMTKLLKTNTAQVKIDQSQLFYDCLRIINLKWYHRKRKYKATEKRDLKKEMLSITEYIDENIKWLDDNPDATSEQLKHKILKIDEYLYVTISDHHNTENQNNRKQHDEL